MAKNNVLDKASTLIDNILSEPELFLSVQPKLAKKLQNLIKHIYDDEDYEKSSKALKQLYVQNCDEEQIWQQIELQNELPILNLSKVLSEKFSTDDLPLTLTEPVPTEDESCQFDDENSEMEQMENESETEAVEKEQPKLQKKRKTKSSVVDDKFFKLEDMNDYILKQEKKGETSFNKKSNDSEEDSDAENVDLFDYPDEDDDDDDESDDGRNIKYADFFDSPESEDERGEKRKFDEVDSEEQEKPMLDMLHKHKNKVRFNLTNDSDDTDSLENKENPEKNDESEEKTNYEKREERLRKRIEKLEEDNIKEKSWQMKGEVSASDRPDHSLLEEYLETDIASRPAPVITEETTERLEDIIKRRIKDKVWDDVEKKFKPVDTPLEYKKKLVLDQEKSKQSLAQIYEQEYLKQKKALDPDTNEEEGPEEPKEHKEIQALMSKLFNQLDALSNYHYTPKPAKPEVKIVSNLPAINMEEVAPVATTDATLLAPEEIKAKLRGDLIGKTERTKTDMKRDRRRKKLRQGNIQKAKELREKETPLVKKKFGKKEDKKEGKKDSNVATQKTHITSTAVFSQLQDEVRNAIKAQKLSKKTKKPKNSFSAVKLKL